MERMVRVMKIHLCILWLAMGICLPALSDTLLTKDGQVLKGRVLLYDDLSRIILKEDGERVILPNLDIAGVTAEKRNIRYEKQKKLIQRVEILSQSTPAGKVVQAELRNREPQQKQHGLQAEAQALLYLLDSEERYGDAYRTSYQWGAVTLELEYQGEKDVLFRKQRDALRGERTRVLGAQGNGLKTLQAAAKGKVRDQHFGFLEKVSTPSKPPEKQKKVKAQQ